MPTSTPFDTAQNTYPRNILEPAVPGAPAWRKAVNLKPSTTFKRGLAIAESTATPGQFAPYNAAGSDNEPNPTALCPFDCSTDASGNITIGATADPAGYTVPTVDAWFGGVFNTADLVKAAGTALDATCAGKLGKLVKGTLTNGLIVLN